MAKDEIKKESKETCEDESKHPCLSLMTELLKLRSGMEHILAPITQKYGLTPMQAVVLHLIHESEKTTTVGTVFKELELNQGNASSMCKRLEADGFITRRRCADDERRVILMLTPKGLRSVDAIGKEAALMNPAFTKVPYSEKQRVHDSICTLTDFAKNVNSLLLNEGKTNA